MKLKHLGAQSLVAVGLGLLVHAAIADEASVERGQALAAVCSACHQADGNGVDNPGGESWPRLAGLDEGYLVKQLDDFKSGRRQNASMQPFAGMLATDQQVADVSAYFASLKPGIEPVRHADKALLARGRQLSEAGDWNRYIVPCSLCHGPNDQGNGSSFPQLAGQHPGYVERQLHDWRAGRRSNDPQQLMASIAKRLSDDDIRAVAAWLASQKAE